jgi:hypothetical protein
VDYGTIRSARLRRLSAKPTIVLGNRRDPSGIVLAGRPSFTVGSIIAAAPTTALPGGLFDRVTAVHHTARGITLSLVSAKLSEAFPQIDVNESIPLSFGPAPAASAARTASAPGPVSISDHNYGGELASFCNVKRSLTFEPTFTGHVTANASLQWPTGRSSVRLAFAGSVGATFTAAAGLNCEKELTALQATTDIPVYGFPMPVTGRLKLRVTLNTTAAVALNASVVVSAWGEAWLDPPASPGAAAGAQLDAKVTQNEQASGQLTITPLVEAEIGLSGASVHVAAGPQLALSGKIAEEEDTCELALNAYVAGGFELLLVSPSIREVIPLFANDAPLGGPLYVCPTRTPQNTAVPTITYAGRLQPDTTLTASNGTWTSKITTMTYAYQWERCDATDQNCTQISGATSPEYTLTNSDVASTIRVVVTVTNPAGAASGTSDATGVVEAGNAEGGAVSFPGGPLTVSVGSLGQCQSSYAGSGNTYYSPESHVGDCGFFLAFPAGGAGQPTPLQGTTWGFDGQAGPAGLNLYTPLSQSPVTGSGTESDPYTEVTVFKVLDSEGSEDALVTVITTYINGASQFISSYKVKNTATTPIYFRAIYAGDLYIGGNDNGTGVFEPGTQPFIGGISTESGAVGGFQEAGAPALPWSSFEEGCWKDTSQEEEGRCAGASPTDYGIWHDVETTDENATAFNESIESANLDNAAGVEWDQLRTAGLSPGHEQAFTIINWFRP